MGKAQSKRSVDITTETKKGSDDEVTEKMEKIEDTDRKEVNGDAIVDPQLEKKDNDDAENDKDTTTEKSDDVQAGGDSAEQCKSSIPESAKEDGTASEDISPLTDENSKKSKKEKVKKKWSLRSISFGKKDKQKPIKTEESTENAEATTNGTEEEKFQENEDSKKEKETAVSSPDETSMEVHENGTATEQEKTEQQTEEMSPDVKSNEKTGNTINPTAEKSENLTIDTAENITSQQTDTTSNTPSKFDVVDIENKSEDNAIDDASKNKSSVEEVNATVNQPSKDEAVDEVNAENKTIPADIKIDTVTVNGNMDEIHQNGSDNVSHPDVEDTKAQIEVKTNTDNKASADALEIISSTHNNPPNVEVHDKHVNALGENFEDVGMEKDIEHEASNCLNEMGNRTDAKYDEKDLKVEKVESNVVKPSTDEKLVHEPSPPPLPISPPPSHVSVFAFTNKEEPADDSLGKTEPISTQMENIEEDLQPAAATTIISTELWNENRNIDDDISRDNKIPPAVEEQFEEILCFQNKDVKILAPHSCIETELISTPSESERIQPMVNVELQNVEEEEVDIEEIEHTNNNALIKDFFATDDKNTQDHLKIENKGVEESENNQVLENMPLNVSKEQDIELLNHKNDDLNQNCENKQLNLENNFQNQLQEPCLYTKKDNDKNDECEIQNNPESPNLDKGDADDEITQLNTHHESQMHDKTGFDKIDNLVREETKEITHTKDLKESATIAEVTQDPSVTCE